MHELTCHGHSQLRGAPDGAQCGAVLRRLPDPVVFLGTRGRRPSGASADDGRMWLRCHRPDCGTWNVFRYASETPGEG